MSVVKGYSSREKEDRLSTEPATVQELAKYRHALDVIAQIAAYEVATDDVEAGSTASVINATSHSARIGDIILFTSGDLNREIATVRSVDANTITLSQNLSDAPAAAVTFSIRRWIPLKASNDGVLESSGGGGGGGETIAAGTRTTGSIVAGSLTGTYATLVAPGAGTRRVHVINWTNGDLLVSYNASTDHIQIPPGKELVEDYGSNFFELSVTISVKQGTKVPTAGTVYGIAYTA